MQIYLKNCKNIQLTRFQKKKALILKNKIKMCFFFNEITLIDKIKEEYDLENELEIFLQFSTE